MKFICCLIVFLAAFKILANDDKPLSDLGVGTKLILPVGNKDLYEKGSMEWVRYTGETSWDYRCSLNRRSHYDYEYAQSIGVATYELQQIHVHSSLNPRHSTDRAEHIRFEKLKNSDIRLPSLSIDCHFYFPEDKNYISIEDFKNFVGMDLISDIKWQSEKKLKIFEAMKPIKRIASQQPIKLALQAKASGGWLPIAAYFKWGKVLYKPDKGPCLATVSSHVSHGQDYEVTFPAQSLFDINFQNAYLTVFDDGDVSYSINIQTNYIGGSDSMNIRCWNDKPMDHLDGVFLIEE